MQHYIIKSTQFKRALKTELFRRSYGDAHHRPQQHWLLCDTHSGPAVFVKTCVVLKFVDDDEDDDEVQYLT